MRLIVRGNTTIERSGAAEIRRILVKGDQLRIEFEVGAEVFSSVAGISL
jgi:hypothetical protein